MPPQHDRLIFVGGKPPARGQLAGGHPKVLAQVSLIGAGYDIITINRPAWDQLGLTLEGGPGREQLVRAYRMLQRWWVDRCRVETCAGDGAKRPGPFLPAEAVADFSAAQLTAVEALLALSLPLGQQKYFRPQRSDPQP